jgi:succinate-semialdehyde dehydrogenase/glutarate-semialdehyde dehydrogenase
MKDADLEMAAEKCVTSRLINSGQSCIAAKRFIVDQAIYDDFKALIIEKVKSYTYGDPVDASTTIGPLARKDLKEKLQQQVNDSVHQGARISYQTTPKEQGYFYPITVLENINPSSPAYSEELFGPIFSLFSYQDEDEAIKIANDTSYGLGSAIFTKDNERALHIAEHQLAFGAVFINDFVKSDPRLPFGGIHESGLGRELSEEGIKEFVNIKTIYHA